MRTIEAYEAADGTLYADEAKARAKDDDLLGAELDGLLRLFKIDIGRHTEYKALLTAMKDRRAMLEACRAVVRIIEHSDLSE